MDHIICDVTSCFISIIWDHDWNLVYLALFPAYGCTKSRSMEVSKPGNYIHVYYPTQTK